MQSAEDEIRTHVASSCGELERKPAGDTKESDNSQHDDKSIREHTLDDRREACARSDIDGKTGALADYGESLCDHARHQRNEQPV